MTGAQTRPMAAGMFMLAGMLVIGLIDNFISTVAGHIGLWQFLLMRFVLSVPLLVVASRLGAGRLGAISWPKVMLRSGLLASAMVFYFGALGFMTIGEALAGLFTSPIFILLISAVVLRQRIGPWRVLAVAVGFGGVLLVLQPGGQGFSWLSLLPVFGGFLYAVGNLVTRYLCAEESTLVMLGGTFFLQGMIGVVAMSGLAVIGPDVAPGADGFLTRGWIWPPDAVIWPIMAMQVVGSLAGVFCLIRAYQWGEASFVSVLEYSIMIFGPGFAYLLFGQTLGGWQLVGTGMIASAGVIIALRSR